MSRATLKRLLIRELLLISVSMFLVLLLSFLVTVLPLPPEKELLHFKDVVMGKRLSDKSDLLCVFVLYHASCLMGIVIGHLMINRHGRTMENFITYAMGGSRLTGNEYTLAVKNRVAAAANDVGKVLVVYNTRVVITHCAFAAFQIFMYLMGCLAGLRFVGRLDPEYGLTVAALSSIFWVVTFKLFAASHQYCLTMAKWALSYSIVIWLVTLSYGVPLDSSFVCRCFIGAIPILVAVYSMRNPVNKLYTIYHAENQIGDVKKGNILVSQIGHTHEDDIEQGYRVLSPGVSSSQVVSLSLNMKLSCI